MANQLYETGRSAFLRGEIDWQGDDMVVALLDGTYTRSSSDEFAADLTGVLATAPLTGCTVLADGVADADDVSVSGVSLGETVERIVIYKDTGSAATSPLIWYADENDDTTTISRAGDGSAITLVWSAAPTRVFRI